MKPHILVIKLLPPAPPPKGVQRPRLTQQLNQALAGAPESIGIVVPFLVITLINLALAVLLHKISMNPSN